MFFFFNIIGGAMSFIPRCKSALFTALSFAPYLIMGTIFLASTVHDIAHWLYPTDMPDAVRYPVDALMLFTLCLCAACVKAICLCPPLMDVVLVAMRIIALNHPQFRFGNMCYPGAPQPWLVADWTFDPSPFISVVMFGPGRANRTDF
jgi:hypothetical protein